METNQSTINLKPSLLNNKRLADYDLISIGSKDKTTELNVAFEGIVLKERVIPIIIRLNHPYTENIQFYIYDIITEEQMKEVKTKLGGKQNAPYWVSLIGDDLDSFRVALSNYYGTSIYTEILSVSTVNYLLDTHKVVLYTYDNAANFYQMYQEKCERVVYTTKDNYSSARVFSPTNVTMPPTELNNMYQAISSVESRILKVISKYGKNNLLLLNEWHRLKQHFK